LHDIEATARALKETAFHKLVEKLVRVVLADAELRPCLDGLLAGEHPAARTNLQEPLEEAQSGAGV
jgi:hypothetical protein